VLRRRPCCLLPRRAETEASITSRRRGCGACALASRARRRRVPLLRALSRSFLSLSFSLGGSSSREQLIGYFSFFLLAPYLGGE